MKKLNRRIYEFGEYLLDTFDYKLPGQILEEEKQKVSEEIEKFRKECIAEEKPLDYGEEDYLKSIASQIHNKWVFRDAERLLYKRTIAIIDYIENFTEGEIETNDEVEELINYAGQFYEEERKRFAGSPIEFFFEKEFMNAYTAAMNCACEHINEIQMKEKNKN